MACAFPPDPVNPDLLTSYIQIAEDFIGRCEKIQILGAQKLKKKCQAELRFLQSLRHKKSRVSNHLSSSNLGHFAAILHAVETLPKVTRILHPLSLPGRENLSVDVIACQGHLWVKVIARKAQALHLVWAGQGQFGEKTLLNQAEDYLKLAAHHQVNFRTPKLCYAFYSGVTKPMAEALRHVGIIVCGTTVDVSQEIMTKLSSVCVLDTDSDEDHDLDIDSESDQELPTDTKEVSTLCDEGMTENENCGPSTQFAKQFEQIDLKEVSSKDFSQTGNSFDRSGRFDKSVKCIRNSTKQVQQMASQANKTSVNYNGFPKYYFFDGDELSAEIKQVFLQDVSTDCLCPELCVTKDQNSILDSSPLRKVNLDVTALIVLVSAVTHGRSHFVFEEPVLSEQAAEERRCPVLPKMKEFLQGKELFACQTAVTAFNTILGTLGGPDEKERAMELMGRVTIVADQPSLRTRRLPTSSKIKERSKVIFGTGDELKMVTLTANSGFVRAANNQGVRFTVQLHAARALTQAKEKTAKIIEMETGETVT